MHLLIFSRTTNNLSSSGELLQVTSEGKFNFLELKHVQQHGKISAMEAEKIWKLTRRTAANRLRKRPHVSNIRSFTIDQSRELWRALKAAFSAHLGIKQLEVGWIALIGGSILF